MKELEIKNVLANIKVGTFTNMEIECPMKSLTSDTITKYQKLVVRFGIEYGNMKINADKDTIGSINGGAYENGYEKYIVEYKNGSKALRYYLCQKVKVEYKLNGQVVDYTYLLDNGYIKQPSPSQQKTIQENPTRNVHLENIISLG